MNAPAPARMFWPLFVRERMAMVHQEAGGAPPNDGAHRLSWWIAAAEDCETVARAIAQRADISLDALERLIWGLMIPCDEAREMIAVATDGAVLPTDWDQVATDDWREPPSGQGR